MEKHKNLSSSSSTDLKRGEKGMCGWGYTATKQDEGKQSNELMHSHVQYIKSLTVRTHFKNKNLVLTEEGQHANDTITRSTPVKKSLLTSRL